MDRQRLRHQSRETDGKEKNFLRTAQEQEQSRRQTDVSRWLNDGLPGGGWQTQGFPQREGLAMSELEGEFQVFRENILTELHPQLRELEQARINLESAERQLTQNINLPNGIVQPVRNEIQNRIPDLESRYQTVLNNARSSYSRKLNNMSNSN